MSSLPIEPGWWVQWSGRTDWQPMDEGSAKLLSQTIVANGDKVVHVEGESKQPAEDPRIVRRRMKLLAALAAKEMA